MPNRGADAMVDCETGEGDTNCSHCQADENKNVYWDICLDQDLLQTILSYYPEWFKNYNMNLALTTSGESDSENPVISLLHARELDGPVKNQIEHTSLQKSMEKNKESLKVKLMLRRPASQLADQGILPPLKTPLAFHEQRQKLERAKMGDLLKNKIQKRPDRKELVRQHILEEGSLTFCGESEALSPSTKLSFDEDSGSDGAFSPSPPYDFNEHSQNSLPPVEPIESSSNCNDGSPGSIRTSFSLSPPSSVPSPMSIFPSVLSPVPQESVPEVLNNSQLPNKDSSKNNKKKAKPKTQQKARTIKFHEYKGPPNAQKNQPPPTTSTESSSYDRLLQQQQMFLQMQLEWQQQKYSQVTPIQKSSGDQSGNSSQSSVPLTQSSHSFDVPSPPQKLISKLEDLKVSDLKAELKKRNLPVSGSKPLLIERLKNYAELPQNSAPITAAAQNLCNLKSPTSTSVDTTIPVCVDNIMMDTSAPPGVDITLPSLTISDTAGVSSSSTVNSLLLSVLNGGTSQTFKMQSTPSIHLDIDSVPVSSVEVMDTSDSSSTSLSNEDIVQLQQRCIEKLQRELERSQLQLQQSFFSRQPTQSSVIANSDCVSPSASSNSVHNESSPIAVTTSTSSNINGSVQNAAAEKLLQRQLIHQQLQQKIHQQQLQLQKQHNQDDEQGKLQTATQSSPSANATLTALLKSQPMNPLPVSGGSLSSIENNSLCSTTVETVQVPNDNMATKSFSGIDLTGHSNSTEAPLLTTSVSTFLKPAIATLNSGTTNKRTSSLPSFSALVNSKPTPTRSQTDPHFYVTRPPPDYDEATRQKTRTKQPSTRNTDANPRSSKKQKSSIKSQAVDDVLEILIKNGELPPSAAQDPSAPNTPNATRKDDSSVSSSLYPSSANPVPSNINVIPPTLIASSVTTSAPSDPSSLHLASLQSVLDMTPPSSAGLVEPNSSAASSLDFDFQFDVDDIDAMDIEVLTRSGHQNMSSQSDPILSVNIRKEEKIKTAHSVLSPSMGLNSSVLQSPELIDLHDKRMDTDLLDWLEVIDDPAGVPTSSSSAFHHPAYSIANDHDPLLSNMTNNHDSLDFFSTDDMDFKSASDLNLLLWDKPDFAT